MSNKFFTWAAIFLGLIVLAINIYISLNYYFLDSCKLPDFYMWQTNVPEK
ncbi:hypothetical protein FHT21_002238 [Pedobacter sp. SG908]|nr:hypothetical protein [Pedobacter sp. SG908]